LDPGGSDGRFRRITPVVAPPGEVRLPKREPALSAGDEAFP